jgi:hypothetical protein
VRECTKCGAPFQPKPGPGRPRARCHKCSPPEKRRDDQPLLSPAAEVPDAGSVVDVIREELTAAGRVDTPKGRITLLLASQLAAGGHTASGAAALARQLEASLDAALDGALKSADGVDELKDRRERRRGA